MPTDFAEGVRDVQRQLAEVEEELRTADERRKTPLLARRGSLLRSLDWYASRIPGRTVQPLGVQVADTIETAERL